MIPDTALAYADASVFVRALLVDEAGHDATHRLMLSTGGRVASWALVRVEVASALRAAREAGRLFDDADALVAERVAFDGPDRPLLLPGTGAQVLDLATAIARRRRVRAIDAMHIAVALTDGVSLAGNAPLVFVTGDARQGEAAAAEGLTVITTSSNLLS